MTRKTGQILNVLLTVSGLIHISGLITNWKYDLYVGLFLFTAGGLSLTNDFLRNGKTFSSLNSVTIDKLDFKWWRIKELIGVVILFFLLVINTGELPDSLLVTLILYFSLMVILDHRRTIEISKKYIAIDGMRIPFERIQTIDFRQGKIILMTDYSFIENPFEQISIDLSDFNKENRELLIEQLKRD